MLSRTINRFFSIKSFSCKDLHIDRFTTKFQVDIDSSDLLFGQDFTPHMAVVDYSDAEGWNIPKIKPLRHFQMHPACSTIHYSLSCFEGII